MKRTLKDLSKTASQGEWGVFDDRGTLEIGHAEHLGERPCIVGWAGFDSSDKPMEERRANARFIAALVNAYRAGELVERSLYVPSGTTAEECIRALVNQWREFGPEGFDETIEAAAKRFCPSPISLERSK